MHGRLAGEIWPNRLFHCSFLGCWLLGNADDSVHPTAWRCSAGNIRWQSIHSRLRKGGESGDKVLHEFSIATWQPPLIKMGLAKNHSRAAQNRPAFIMMVNLIRSSNI